MTKVNSSRLVLLWVCFLFLSGALQADVFYFPLSEAVGPVNGQTVSLNLPTTFESINYVYIQANGVIAYGVGMGDGVERPVYPFFDWPAAIKFYFPDPYHTGGCSGTIGPMEGWFDEIIQVTPSFGATWDFLFDGQAQLQIYLSPNIIVGGVMMTPPSATLTDVLLIIDGEPEEDFIRILSPDGAERFIADTDIQIEWHDSRDDQCHGNEYLLEYTLDGGQSWLPAGAGLVSNACSLTWTTPVANSDQCRIRVTDSDEPNLTDASNADFCIFQCPLLIEGDINNDCYVNFEDFTQLAQTWLDPEGYFFSDLMILAQHWCECGNPFDPYCNP